MMRKKLFLLFNKLVKLSESRVDYHGARYTAFGIFSVINYLMPFYMWSDIHEGEPETYILRIAATVLSFLLAISEMWESKWKKYRPLYWHFTIMFCLPFFVTFMIWYDGLTLLWIINANLAILLGLILLDFKSFAIIYSLGIFLGTCTALTMGEHLLISAPGYSIYPSLYMGTFIFVIVIIFSRDFAKKRSLQFRAMKILASSIADEVRTPLSTLRIILKSIETNQAPSSNQNVSLLNKKEMALKVIKRISYILDSILTKVSFFSAEHVSLEDVSIQDLIKKFSQKYSILFDNNPTLHIDIKEDFVIQGSEELLVHVLLNLVQNAVYQIKAENKGEIKCI